MRAFLAFALLAAPLAWAQDGASSKRGLGYVVPEEDPADDHYWNSEESDLTWYYNWDARPTNAITLEWVPMLWGSDGADSFYDTIKSQIDGGSDIKYVLGFNEPDGCADGGSCVDAQKAAQIWIEQIEPLKELGLTLGSPAVTGSPRGLQWMQDFFTACDGGCSPDFYAAHWYGPFEAMASYLGQVNGTYPNMTLWVTEYGLPDAELEETQIFFNQSMEYFDRLEFLERYAYFGAFRSDVSNVGPNAALLTQSGAPTDLGAYYLGQPELAEGNIPMAKGAATTKTSFAGWIVVVIFAAAYSVL